MKHTMRYCLCIIGCFFSLIVYAQKPVSIFKNGDRVCFVGNSITHNGEFHHNIFQYFVTRYPKQKINFFNAGIKGDVTGGIIHRIDKDILIHKPTHAVIMIGMNDVQRNLYSNNVIYNADTLQRRKVALELYSKNLDSIVRIFTSKGVKVILQKPTPYDETSLIKASNGLGINNALYECSKIIQKLADQYKLPVVDYWSFLTNISTQIQKNNPSATLTVNDRVHPNSTGHMLMAYQFIKSFQCPSIVSTIEIDVNNLSNKTANINCEIEKISIADNKVIVTILENALPFSVDEKQQPAISLVPFMHDLNSQILKVKNLSVGKYELLIDDIIIDSFSNDKVSKGINLSQYKQTPQYKQALQVRKKLTELWDVEATLRAVAFVDYMHLKTFVKKSDIDATKKYLDSLYATQFKGQSYYANSFEKYITYNTQVTKLLQTSISLTNEIYKIAQPTKHVFTLRKVEEPSVASLIEASQSSAMPLLFEVKPNFSLKKVDEFISDKEFFLRNGLPNFFNKLSQQNPTLKVAFLGGSITKAEDQYRNQTLAFLQTLNPTARLHGINAGVSGTGTELGSCRVNEQVLTYKPDLVFIEFAVNGGSNQALEGIVRQVIKNNPQTDICFIYTIAGEQYKQYAKDTIPSKIQGFEKVADHYQIPSIHLGLYPSMLVSNNKLIWKSNTAEGDKIIFSKDGTHPLRAGGDLYAQAIARAFQKFKILNEVRAHELIKPLYQDNWEDAGMYSPNTIANFSKGWETLNAEGHENLKVFAPWFTSVFKAVEPNAFLSFKFTGTAFGFFDIGGPEVGQIQVEIDGQCATLTRKAGNASNKLAFSNELKCVNNRFNTNCNNRYRGQFEIFEVPEGTHEVKIILSSLKVDKIAILDGQDLTNIQQNPNRYNQHVFYLGKILLRGTVIDK